MRFAERAERRENIVPGPRHNSRPLADPQQRGSGALVNKLVRRPVWLEGSRGPVRASCAPCAAAGTALHACFADAR
jgi:hypothetical protein